MTQFEEYYNMGYGKQREGKKDHRWYIRFCDWLFRHHDHSWSRTRFDDYLMWFIALIPFLWVPMRDRLEWNPYWLLLALVVFVLMPSKRYRVWRHKYLQTHDLPGPYGWGTIDKECWVEYNE